MLPVVWILDFFLLNKSSVSLHLMYTQGPGSPFYHTGITQLHVLGEQLFSDSYDILKNVKKVVSVQSWKTQGGNRCR